MGISFDNTSYLKAVKTYPLDIERDFSNREIQFYYGNADYNAFLGKYDDDGWIGRKIIALPVAFFSAVVRATYHLALALFVGTFKAFFDKGVFFKAYFYNFIRDEQEAYGRILSLFNDKLGLFHIQESQFQRTCYQMKLCDKNTPPPSRVEPLGQEPNYYGNYSNNFNRNEARYSTRTEPVFPQNRNRQGFATNYSTENSGLNKYNNMNYEQFREFFPLGYFSDSKETKQTQAKLAALSDLEFLAIVDKLDDAIYYSIIPDNHINKLNFETIDRYKIFKLFPLGDFGSNAERKKSQEKLALLSSDNFKALLPKFIYDDEYFSIIPDCHLHNINFDVISGTQLKELFPLEYPQAAKIKFAKLTSKEVLKILSRLADPYLELISQEQLQDIALKVQFDLRRNPPRQTGTTFNSPHFKEKFRTDSPSGFGQKRTTYTPPNSRTNFNSPSGQRNSGFNSSPHFSNFSQRNTGFNSSPNFSNFGSPNFNVFDDDFEELLKAHFGTFNNFPSSQGSGGIPRYTAFNFGGGSPFREAKPTVPEVDHYKTLGIPKNSTGAEIKKAYRKLTLEYHPDRIKQNDNESDADFKKREQEAAEKIKAIITSYEALTDPTKAARMKLEKSRL